LEVVEKELSWKVRCKTGFSPAEKTYRAKEQISGNHMAAGRKGESLANPPPDNDSQKSKKRLQTIRSAGISPKPEQDILQITAHRGRNLSQKTAA